MRRPPQRSAGLRSGRSQRLHPRTARRANPSAHEAGLQFRIGRGEIEAQQVACPGVPGDPTSRHDEAADVSDGDGVVSRADPPPTPGVVELRLAKPGSTDDLEVLTAG